MRSKVRGRRLPAGLAAAENTTPGASVTEFAMEVTAEVMGEATAAGEGRIPPLATAAAAAAAAKAGWLLGMDVRVSAGVPATDVAAAK